MHLQYDVHDTPLVLQLHPFQEHALSEEHPQASILRSSIGAITDTPKFS